MAKSLKQLKSSRKEMYESIQGDIKKSGKKDYSDSRFWRPAKNPEGAAFAEVRFLPAPPDTKEYGEEVHSFVKVYSHSFSGPSGKLYINESLTTIDKEDPVTEFNNMLWNMIGTEEAKNQARDQKRKVQYIANILVVRDPVKPENEGKVFLWRFGTKIFDKITSSIAPPKESGRDGVNIFDPWDGANFHVEAAPNVVNGNSFLDYAGSQFGQVSAIDGGNDDKINSLWEQQYSLNQFVDQKNTDFYKTYDELKTKLEFVMGAKFEQLLDPTFVQSGKVADPMKALEQQTATLDNFLNDDDDDDIPSFVKDPVEEPKSKETTNPPPAGSQEPPEVDDVDLQGLADLDGLDDI